MSTPSASENNANTESLAKPAWGWRALLAMIAPLMVEQALVVTMGACDTIMVSSVGEAAVSGVNIVDNINNLLIIALASLATGGAVVVSQYIGRRDKENAATACKQLVYSVFSLSIVITILAVIFCRPIIALIYGHLSRDVMGAASTYLFITALSFPFLALYNASSALFRANGNTKVTMRIAFLVNIFNVAGNAIFIFVFKWGVLGAGLSTLLARVIAAAVSVALLVKARPPVSLAGVLKVKLTPAIIRSILRVGVPTGIENSMFQMGRLLTQRIFPVFGTAAIAGNAIASVINSFSFTTGMAYGMVLLTVTGQCAGAGDFAGAKAACAKIMKLSYLTMLFTNGLIYIFLHPLVSLFNLTDDSFRYAVLFLRVHCISMVIGWPTSFALPNALRAAGDGRFVMIAASISMWALRVSSAYILCFVVKVGPVGVWLAMGADFVVRSICYVSRWTSGKWQGKRVL